MGSLSLGRPKWGGSTWAKGGPRGEGAWGSFQEASPPPPWFLPREEETLGRSPRAAPSSKVAPLPLPL